MRPLPIAGHCPAVNEATNRFEGNFAAFWVSQMYFLMYELVHFYIDETMEERLENDGPMDWNYAVSLSPENATFNALNYVLFVASKSNFICGTTY